MQSHMMLLRAEMVGKSAAAPGRRVAENPLGRPAPLFARWRRRSSKDDGEGAMRIVAAQALETERLRAKTR